MSRTRTGDLAAVVNACAHRGAMVCRQKKDNRSTWTCPFHGWTYRNDGTLLKAKDPRGRLPGAFNKDGSHDIVKVPRFESYRGFLFGSLNADVLPLPEHLGETAKLIDLMVDQSADGLEVLKGASTYTYDGNWKVQAENGADGYHVASTHWNYGATTARRLTGDRRPRPRRWTRPATGSSGAAFTRSSTAVPLWTTRATPQDRPLYERRAGTHRAPRPAPGRLGDQRARNLCLYPNVYLMDQFSSQIRQYRPIAVDKTEVTIHCIAPRARARRRGRPDPPVRGLFQRQRHGHPDDLEEFRASQNGFLAAPAAPWNDMSRGATHGSRARTRTRGRSGSTRSEAASRWRTRACTRSSTATGDGDAAGRHRRLQSAVKKTPGVKTDGDPGVEQFLYREARMLDDRDFEGWLECYAPDAEFWMLAWDDDDTLSIDPQREISLIWYGNRGGLEDGFSGSGPNDRARRAFRSRGWATTSPMSRSSPRRAAPANPLQLVHPLLPLRRTDTYFGTSFYTLDTSGQQPLIKKKKVILKNDYIHHVVDIYHV